MCTSYNRAYLATANAFAQIQPIGWTSDTLETLSEMRAFENIGVGQNEATDLYRYVCHWRM